MSTMGPITLRLFTVEEAADTLKLPKSWLYERTRKNAIPFRRIGKYVRFTAEDITEIIGAHTIHAIPPDGAIWCCRRPQCSDSEAQLSGAAKITRSSIERRLGKQKWESGFHTKAAAQARLNEVLRELGTGHYVDQKPKQATFASFAEEWIGKPGEHSRVHPGGIPIDHQAVVDAGIRPPSRLRDSAQRRATPGNGPERQGLGEDAQELPHAAPSNARWEERCPVS